MKKAFITIVAFLLSWLALDWGVSTFFQVGLEKYYGLDQEADILLIGHSHMMKSCDKAKLEEALQCKISKYCREGVMVQDRYAMVQHFLDSQKDGSVPYVLYGVDPFMFQEGDLSLNSYKLFYPFMDHKVVDNLIRSEVTTWHDYPIHKYIRCTRITDNMIYRSLRGWVGYWTSFQNGKISDERWNAAYNWDICMPEKTVQTFHKTINYLIERGCHVILVHPPVAEGYEKGNPEAFAYMMSYYQQMADNSPHIDFLDYGKQFSHSQEIFEDPVHVNREGAKQMTQALIADLKRIMNKR